MGNYPGYNPVKNLVNHPANNPVNNQANNPEKNQLTKRRNSDERNNTTTMTTVRIISTNAITQRGHMGPKRLIKSGKKPNTMATKICSAIVRRRIRRYALKRGTPGFFSEDGGLQ